MMRDGVAWNFLKYVCITAELIRRIFTVLDLPEDTHFTVLAAITAAEVEQFMLELVSAGITVGIGLKGKIRTAFSIMRNAADKIGRAHV